MINTRVKVHDQFSVEFKIGSVITDKKRDANKFKINTWIFLPNGLDINKTTYTKEQFYSDIKSNVRLITPIYTLPEILMDDRGPFPRMQKAYEKLLSEYKESNEESFVYQEKMLICIVKSALREIFLKIIKEKNADSLISMIKGYAYSVKAITERFRTFRDEFMKNEQISEKLHEYFLFGDEYMSYIVEQTSFELMRLLRNNARYEEIKNCLIEIVNREIANKKAMNYTFPEENNEEKNSLVLIKRSLLKKFVESDLYLQRVKKKDGAFAREFYYSLAAGLAMIFTTIISFAATLKYGNFTSTLFVVLVISYMFKDRIKEFSRTYFSHRLDKKYFDHKWEVSIRNQPIGSIKEAFDFVKESQIPQEIINLRNKSSLVQAENEVYDEKVILYRKRVSLSKDDLEKYKEYRLSGINDIIRLNLTSFTKKMDNPSTYMYLPKDEEGYQSIRARRVYALYFILECQSDDDVYYKKYRVLFNRTGIQDAGEME